MTILLEEMAQGQVAGLDFGRTVAILPLSPLEEHGPHLPVGTDLVLSLAMARELAARIEGTWPGIVSVLCPLLPLGADVVSGPGSVRTGQRALHDVLFDFVRSLGRTGFKHILLCSAHGGIGNFVAQEEVAERARRELGVRVEPALSRVILPFLTGALLPEIERSLGRPITPKEREALRSDVHGGQWETGCMLAFRPDLVHAGYKELPAVPFRGWLRLRRAMENSCANGLGYVGAPAEASIEYARAAGAVLQGRVLERVDAMLHSSSFRPSHSPFYYLPGYRSPSRYTPRRLVRTLVSTFAAGLTLGVGAGVLGTRLFGPGKQSPEPGESPRLDRAIDRQDL